MNKKTSNITDVLRKPRKCPYCGGKVVPILYGEPSIEGFEMAERGEVALGGFIVWESMPDYQCLDCGHLFRKVHGPGLYMD